MIVKWGLEALPDVLRELSVKNPLIVTTARWRDLPLPVSRRFCGARPHADVTGVREATEALDGADGLVALGGGSAIDTAKAVSTATSLPIVSIPTTYSGAEWTPFFGNRDSSTGLKVAGAGAKVAGIVYAPELTVDLPAFDTGGTAMNALAHCAEALFAPQRSEETDADALEGARLISRWLPQVLAEPHDIEARTELLRGAMHAGEALRAGMCLGHAMAQALGGGLGLPHGPMNAVCLPHSLRFNREAAAEALTKLSAAMGVSDPVEATAALGALSCPMRLRDYGVDREALPGIAEKVAVRPAALANPRPASVEDIRALLLAAW